MTRARFLKPRESLNDQGFVAVDTTTDEGGELTQRPAHAGYFFAASLGAAAVSLPPAILNLSL